MFNVVVEHREQDVESEKVAFYISDIVVYDFPGADIGFIGQWNDELLQVNECTSKPDLVSYLKLNKGEEYSVTSTGNRNKFRTSRASATQVFDEDVDVIGSKA